MLRRIFTTSIFIFLALLLTGCWSSRELTDLAITTALGVDYEDGQFVITAQVINPSELAGQNVTTRTAVSTYTASGNTMFEAIRKLTTVAPRKLYLAHIRAVVFGEEYAKKGIGGSLDYISRDHELRTDFLFTVAKDQRAQDVLKILTPLERIPANKIHTSLEASQKNWAPTKVVQLDELISSMINKGKEAVLTGLQVLGDPDEGAKLSNVENVQTPTSIKTGHLGVFEGDRLVGWMNQDESKGFNYITNNIKNTVTWVECKNEGKISIEIIQANSKVEGKMQGNTPKIKIETMIEANIADVECVIDLSNRDTIKDLQEKFKEKKKNIMQSSINRAKELKTDIFGFGETISLSEVKKWKTIEKDWKNIFAEELEVDIKVEVNIRRTGTTTQSFFKNIKEKNEEGSP